MLMKLDRRRFRALRVFFDPGRLRALTRRSEVGLSLAGAVVGIISGLAVTGMSYVSNELHQLVFGIADSERLSSSEIENKLLLLTAPVIGGALLGLLLFVLAKRRKKPMVDPIEANALHGGRLSLTDSIIVAVQNLISNGFGASVGLEAGYTQLAAGLASKFGLKLQLRRSDLRTLVGCGAAGAIAAAFNAPLTGAFYAFELIIGTYTIVSLTPVVVSALVSTLIARLLAGSDFTIDIGSFGSVVPADYIPALLLGAFCAGVGILIMQGVAFVEELARKSSIAPPFRPALGGIIVGLLAMISPQVLSAGHGALHLNLSREVAIPTLIGLFLLKSFASAISIGSGFRGGLFFASLFMGALLGKLFAYCGPYFADATLTPVIYAVVGMSSLAVAVIGGPLTMTFLALEITGDFPITALVLAAVITSSLVVRSTFGYSFATWRFHLRGESIRSAHDVGWIRNLTVDKLMRADVKTARAGISLEEFKQAFPIGSTQRVILVEESDKYAGLVLVPEIYANPTDAQDEGKTLADFVHYRNDFLQPQMNARQAAAIFDKSESEALAVVNNLIERKVIGQLSESYTLRRYSEELDRRRREVSGEI
ncbi:chloride channel protein [Rhizobium johnstonii]|uniref:Transmembrane ion channel protein n=2 Tax=Rhizobium TaxID=379 RepID=Q1MFF1_RHIJ3|nr:MULTISPECIES: chloride channel protein [Rhizobium]MBY5319039.1 chloride channel protein [Rhizobium leguminosarum]MBY5372210.1 chloride channel protein [Rhizobium leguminosarum]MBY5380733.1 chloride channel protein [Rhizobium leguminosarum]MBY5414044.1 chloride channel protein [Rhizobium leguminosarum]MBY5422391.1 chloride channel protein [Rhizobium leguminosarum]